VRLDTSLPRPHNPCNTHTLILSLSQAEQAAKQQAIQYSGNMLDIVGSFTCSQPCIVEVGEVLSLLRERMVLGGGQIVVIGPVQPCRLMEKWAQAVG